MGFLFLCTYCCILKINLKKWDKFNPELVSISYLVQTLSETKLSLWISSNQILQELSCTDQLEDISNFFQVVVS